MIYILISYASPMKKLSEGLYLTIWILCFIFSYALLGEKYGVYHSLPSYHLFEMPNETYGGNILFHFFKWNLTLILFFLTLFVISFIFKIKIGFFKHIAKAIKERDNGLYLFLFPILIGPLGSLLFEYSDLLIGIKWLNGTIFHITFLALVVIFIIVYFIYNLIKRK